VEIRNRAGVQKELLGKIPTKRENWLWFKEGTKNEGEERGRLYLKSVHGGGGWEGKCSVRLKRSSRGAHNELPNDPTEEGRKRREVVTKGREKERTSTIVLK